MHTKNRYQSTYLYNQKLADIDIELGRHLTKEESIFERSINLPLWGIEVILVTNLFLGCQECWLRKTPKDQNAVGGT